MHKIWRRLYQWFNGNDPAHTFSDQVQKVALTEEMDVTAALAGFLRGEQADLDTIVTACQLNGVSIDEAIRQHNHANRHALGLSGQRPHPQPGGLRRVRHH